jgi:tRNA A-37 threonylcarbamoyl transferase component Bud32
MDGTVLGGRYRLESRIAAGGMGEVWRAHDETLDRTVAVKLMHAQLSHDPGFLERFRREARHTAALSHPGIAAVYDYGETVAEDATTRAYLVMQLIEGRSLHEVLEQDGRLAPQRTLDVVAQVASALQAAHAAGVVHRDVKPANLLLRSDGSVVVTDFGIARSVHSTGHLTVPGEVLGTAAYLAPEQAEGKPATPLTDVYSLGIVAYQCLAGIRPFQADTPVATALAHLREPAPPLPPDVPEATRAIVERAMAKDPADRFTSAAALAEAARAVAAGHSLVPPPARPSGPPPTALMTAPAPRGPGRPPRSVLVGVAAGVVLALLLGVGIAATLRSGDRAADVARPASSPTATRTVEPEGAAVTPPLEAVEDSSAAWVVLDPADYVGRPVAEVRNELVALGLEVDEQVSGRTGRAGRVAGVAPARVRSGDTVTVAVFPAVAERAPQYQDRKSKDKSPKGKGPKHDDDEDEQGDDT